MKRKNLFPVWLLLVTLFILPACSGDENDDGDDDDDVDDTGNDDDDTDDSDDDTSGMDDDTGGDDDDTIELWTDSSSGLTWQVTPSNDRMMWDDTITYCQNLSIASGGWRLPTISELRTLIRGCDATVTGGACGVTDSCLDESCWDESCLSCEHGNGPNNGCYGPPELQGECEPYWSSSAVTSFIGNVWDVMFDYGFVEQASVGDGLTSDYARCVRP